MDSCRYKDYILFMLFIKYIGDKTCALNQAMMQPLLTKRICLV